MLSAKTLSEADRVWDRRNALSGRAATNLYAVYGRVTLAEPESSQAWWKYSRALNFYGMHFAASGQEKKDVYLKARQAAETAVRLAPSGAAGYAWLGISVGNWGQVNGIMNSLKAIPLIEQNMLKSISLDPGFGNGLAYTVLGRLYTLTPGKPVSIGDKDKAESYLKKAVDAAPGERRNYYYLADLYYMKKMYPEALELVGKARSMPVRPSHRLEDEREMQDIITLQKKIEAKADK